MISMREVLIKIKINFDRKQEDRKININIKTVFSG